MSQEAPADTAGPSSPPPQLPEGWLPQWEGVQRKWYFVQRATGKSQWEIPTEPVVLTPSTTPTSIGTGPTYPPSRPSTNSPRAMEVGATSLAQRIEPTMGSARIASSLDAQLHSQLTHPTYGSPETQKWYLNQTNQQTAHGFGQHFSTHDNQYGSQPYPNYGTGPSPSFPSHGQDNIQSVAGRQALAGGSGTMPWGDTGASYANAEGYAHNPPQDSYTGFPLTSQYSQSPARNMESNLARNHPPNLMDAPPPEPQWHPSQQPLVSNASTDSVSTGFPPSATQQFYRSYPTPQTVGASPREFASRSSQSSNPSHSESEFAFSRENSQSAHGSLSMQLPRGLENAPNGAGHSMSRSHSQHAEMISPQGSHVPGVITQSSHIHPPHPQPSRGQYQVADMSQTQLGVGYASAGYAVPETQGGAPNYQKPPVQSGIPQSLPSSQQSNYKQGSGYLMAAGQSSQTGALPEYQNPWESTVPITSRSAASDPQFVSGPWSSTPPTSGPLQPPRHG